MAYKNCIFDVEKFGESVSHPKNYLVAGQELIIEGPWRIPDNLVDVSAVADALVAVVLVHDGFALVGASESIAADAD